MRKQFTVLCLALFAGLSLHAQLPVNVYLQKSGSLTAASASCLSTNCVAIPVSTATGSVAVQLAGTFTATVTFEGTVDGTNYLATAAFPVATGAAVTTATVPGIWQVPSAGFVVVRARCSAFTSGTITTTLSRSPVFNNAPNPVTIGTALSVNSLTSAGAVSGTTGTFSGAVSGTSGTFTGALSGAPVSGTAPNIALWVGGFIPDSLTAGTDTTGVANQQWIGSLWLSHNMTLTGVSYLIGSVGGTDKAIVALYNAAGTTLLANSTTASSGTTVGSAGTTQSLAFTSPYAATAGLYWVTVQTNGTTAKIRTQPLGVSWNGVQAAGGAAPAATIGSLPTTFTAAYAPIAVMY